jgi:hypothetical protein
MMCSMGPNHELGLIVIWLYIAGWIVIAFHLDSSKALNGALNGLNDGPGIWLYAAGWKSYCVSFRSYSGDLKSSPASKHSNNQYNVHMLQKALEVPQHAIAPIAAAVVVWE